MYPSVCPANSLTISDGLATSLDWHSISTSSTWTFWSSSPHSSPLAVWILPSKTTTPTAQPSQTQPTRVFTLTLVLRTKMSTSDGTDAVVNSTIIFTPNWQVYLQTLNKSCLIPSFVIHSTATWYHQCIFTSRQPSSPLFWEGIRWLVSLQWPCWIWAHRSSLHTNSDLQQQSKQATWHIHCIPLQTWWSATL